MCLIPLLVDGFGVGFGPKSEGTFGFLCGLLGGIGRGLNGPVGVGTGLGGAFGLVGGFFIPLMQWVLRVHPWLAPL